MPKPLFIANWKMNKTAAEAEAFFVTFKRRRECWRGADVIILPSFPILALVAARSARTFGLGTWEVGAQNMFWEEAGAFTGEVSSRQIVDAGAEHVLIGHSERRHLFDETDMMVQKKVRAALDAKLNPIIAVGETAGERGAKKTLAVIRKQLTAALKKVEKKELGYVTIAYEPVWAIGTGMNATPDQIEEVHAYIRTRAGRIPRIIYGGSMSPKNVQDIMKQKHVNGGLVGGAALDAGVFADLIREGVRKN